MRLYTAVQTAAGSAARPGTIYQDGGVSGRVPRGVSVTREAILEELLRILQGVNPGFWKLTRLPILPDADPAEYTRGETSERKSNSRDFPALAHIFGSGLENP